MVLALRETFDVGSLVVTALPQPSDRLIGYLDLLGWSEIVRDEKRAGDVAGAMLEVQAERDTWEMARAFTGQMGPVVQMSEFSDCVAFSCDVDSEAARNQLLHRLFRLHLLWLDRGFLSRGALVIGRAVHAENVIYGSGLVDAYRLERQVAVFPRIVVRETDVARLGLEKSVIQMDDGVQFLNPLLHGLYPPNHLAPVEVIRGNVETQYRLWQARWDALKRAPGPRTAEEMKILAKHEWLLRYFERAAAMIGLNLVN